MDLENDDFKRLRRRLGTPRSRRGALAAYAAMSAAAASKTGLVVNIRKWQAVGVWTWNAGDEDDVCGICRVAFDACPPDAKFPGDDSPVVWGQCGHAFHLQCITKWLNSQTEQRCPICRGAWEFAQDKNANEDDALGERVLRDAVPEGLSGEDDVDMDEDGG